MSLIPPLTLAEARFAASPRTTPPKTPVRAVLIHGGITLLWVALFCAGFLWQGALAWSVGLVYVAYDTALLGFVAWQTRKIGAPPEPGPPLSAGARPSLSVIIAAYNEALVLPATLGALFAQSDVPDRIVIADDGSTDGTAEMLGRVFGLQAPPIGTLSGPAPNHPGLYWLRAPHGGKAQALNATLGLIDTDIVLTVDADTQLQPDAIAATRRAFAAEPDLVATTGVLTPRCDPTPSGRVLQYFQHYEYIRNFLSRYAWMQMDALLLISGAFAGFRREALVTVGGFDPDCLVEDYELIHRLRRYAVRHGHHWTTRVLGDARGSTHAPGTIPNFLSQRRRWFGGFLQTQFWYRDMIGNGRYGWLGTLMLPVKAADTMQPIYGLTALALLGFYVVTGRFGIAGPGGSGDRRQDRAGSGLPPALGGAVSPLAGRPHQRAVRLRPRRRRAGTVQLPDPAPWRRGAGLGGVSHRAAPLGQTASRRAAAAAAAAVSICAAKSSPLTPDSRCRRHPPPPAPDGPERAARRRRFSS